MIDFLLAFMVALVGLPMLAYLMVKMGTAGYLRAISQFRNPHDQESRNGDGNEEA